MGRLRFGWVAAGLGLALILACGIDVVASGDGSPRAIDGGETLDGRDPRDDADSVTSADAALDADARTLAPACAPGNVFCNGACVTATDCAGCSGAPLLCKELRTCSATCGSCTSLGGAPAPIECFACNTSQENPIGTCEARDGGFCLNANYSTAYGGVAGKHCDCSDTEVANCPGQGQICASRGDTDWCITCGESGENTDGKACKGGGTCDTSLSPPRCN